MLKSVVIGTGSRANVLLPHIVGVGDVSVEAVVEPDSERRSGTMKRFDIPNGFESLNAFFDAGIEVDTAWIFTPPHLHVDAFVQCVSRKLNTFCEKPIEMDLAGAEQMVNAARRSGVKTMFGFNRRFMPVGRLARALCKDEKPVYVHVAKSRPMCYTRMLSENAVHAVDTMLRLAGSTPETVRAVGRFERADIEAEEYVCATVQFANRQAGMLQMITKGSGVVERFEVYGDGFTLLARMPAEIWYSGDDERLQKAVRDAGLELKSLGEGGYTLVADDNSGNLEEIRQFVAHIRNETYDVPGVEEAFEAQRLVEAIYRSAGLR